jgi:two-component system NtrC family sensor kinase
MEARRGEGLRMELKASQGELPKDVGIAGEMEGEAQRKRYYSRLYRKFILINLVCSLVPLLLVGWAINSYYTGFAESRMTTSFEHQVDHHRKIIELFLRERSSRLRIIAQTHSKEYLGQASNLAHVFEILNQEYGSMEDLGVIDDQGKHVAYVGPYDLMDKDYSQTTWFKNVMVKGLYISDMFTGWRKVPHFIIAILRVEKGEKWILRATIDTKTFRSLVENVRIGQTGEVYLVNEEGVFQTTPASWRTDHGESPCRMKRSTKHQGSHDRNFFRGREGKSTLRSPLRG